MKRGKEGKLRVEGKGYVTVIPDNATVMLAIQHNAMTTAEVWKKLKEKTSRVETQLDSIMESGAEDVEAVKYEFAQQSHDYRPDYDDPRYYDTVFDGYSGRQMVAVKCKSSDAAKIVQAILESDSIASIDKLKYSISEELMQPNVDRVIGLAVEDAQRKIRVALGTLAVETYYIMDISLSEYNRYDPEPGVSYETVRAPMYQQSSQRSPVEQTMTLMTLMPQPQTVSANVGVSVVYE
jgi:uncharacterized protein YggE